MTAAVPAHDRSAGATTENATTAATDNSVQTAGAVPQQLPSATIGSTSTASLTATAATHAAVPLSGLALEIAASVKNGKSSFEIRLDPTELGRIDVRIDVDRNGQMTSHLTVEKPATLAMLQQDAPQLQRALDNAGFKTGDGGLQFSLRDQSSSGQNSGNDTNRNAQRLVISNEDSVPVTTAGRSYGRMLGSSSGVDISV
ncbi:MAG TPA: flagellar hook-length control protein FliK [Bradyrhizobium sp.]